MPLSGQAAFRRLIWTALLTGLITGILLALLQQVTTLPLILQAEIQEHSHAAGPMSAPAAAPSTSAASAGTQDIAEHGTHDHGDWAPQDGFGRTAYTALTSVLAATGYALLLGAILHLIGKAGLRAGLQLGVAGFLVFQLAPALGLPPAPPGMPMAELLPRQAWWLGTVIATALALVCWQLARVRAARLWIPLGIALIILPHAIGAPQPPAQIPAASLELAQRFATQALATAAVFWLVLGALMGYLQARR